MRKCLDSRSISLGIKRGLVVLQQLAQLVQSICSKAWLCSCCTVWSRSLGDFCFSCLNRRLFAGSASLAFFPEFDSLISQTTDNQRVKLR